MRRGVCPGCGLARKYRNTPWDVYADASVCERGGPDIVVDGILGTGFSGSLRPLELELVGRINALEQRAFIFSLDIPSGLSGLTGRPCPVAVRAHATVTFEAAKPGLVLPEAAPYTGRLHIRPIGIPAVVRRAHPASCQMITKAIAGAFPEAAPGWHKGTAGAILIVGGSEGLTGAPHLAARAALRAGGGLISVAAPHGLCRDIKADCPDIMTRALGPAGNVRWSPALLEELLPFLRQCGGMVLGPGIGREPETAAFVQALLMCPSRPSAVVDADALHALAMHPEALSSLRACDVLTPHPGEAATLLHTTPALVQADRFAALAGLRRLAPSVWILKGAGTLIGTAGQPVTIAPYAEPNLAVGGSGDVLSGCLGTLMAQTAAHPSEGCESSSFLAACMGVYLHARGRQAAAGGVPAAGQLGDGYRGDAAAGADRGGGGRWRVSCFVICARLHTSFRAGRALRSGICRICAAPAPLPGRGGKSRFRYWHIAMPRSSGGGSATWTCGSKKTRPSICGLPRRKCRACSSGRAKSFRSGGSWERPRRGRATAKGS